ncbi:MAG: squalene/phytoene synthase family protein [Candidatus Tumulicola sp.]
MRKEEPAAAPDLTLDAADAYCRFLTEHHYENFSVASRFIDAARRTDLARIYAYCRSTDDLGDESPEGTALRRLERWRAEVEGLFASDPPVHPVLVALQRTIARHRIPAAPFLDLIEANVMDQQMKAYPAWSDLERYCALSAAPVGRMVLRVFGITDPECERLSDDVCVGLQLANHAQDASRDALLGRSYLVQSDVARSGKVGATRALVDRARTLLDSGRALARRVDPVPLRLQVTLYRLGGLAICDAIERRGYETATHRPSVSSATKAALVVRAVFEALYPTAARQSGTTTPHPTK